MISDTTTTAIAEVRLLKAIISNPTVLNSEGISKELFLRNKSKNLFDSILSLTKLGVALSRDALAQEYSKYDVDASVEFIDSVLSLEQQPDTSVADMVTTLKQGVRIEEASECLKKAISFTNSYYLTPEQRVEYSNLLYQAQNYMLDSDKTQVTLTMDEWAQQYMESFDKRKDGKQYTFGDTTMDSMVASGPAPGTIGIICASTGMCKSSFVLNLVNKTINRQVPCMYFSLEMGAIDTMDRLISIRTNVPYATLINPQSPEDFEACKDIVEQEHQALKAYTKFRYSEDPSLSLADIESEIVKFQHSINQQYTIVYIDLLSMVTDFAHLEKGASLATIIELAVNKANAMAKRLGVHIVAVLQLNRNVESSKVFNMEDIERLRPNRSSVKNSGAFLERCRYCISLFRKKYYALTYLPEDPETEDLQDIVEVSMLKQNNGSTGRKYQLFNAETFKMSEVPSVLED